MGWLLAAPPLAILGLIIFGLATKDKVALLGIFVDPNVIAILLVVQIALFGWRIAAVTDAFRIGDGKPRERGAALTAAALAFVLVPSVYAAYLTEVAREAALSVFAPVEQPWEPTAFNPYERDDDFGVLPTALPSPPPELGRFTVLLIGADSGPDRSHALTDTMIVASLDPVIGVVSMVSVPRDLVDTPLPDGRTFYRKINELVSYANRNPEKFPGAASGQAVLAGALGTLLNVKIDGWAQVNLPGFVKVIDAIGGVDVTVRRTLCDYRYREYGINGFYITPGRYHLDGEEALAYSRIRKSAGENDFTRAARQGEVVVAARDQLIRGGFLNDPAGLIQAMGELVQTSLDPSTITTYLPDAIGITRDRIFRAVITYPLVHGAANDPRGSILVPRMELIRDLAAHAFPPAGTMPTELETIPVDSTAPIKTSLPSTTCTAPAPNPTPKPTTAPTSSFAPTAPPSAEPTTPPDPTPEPSVTPKPGGGPKTPPPTEPPPDPTAPPPDPSAAP